jgi:Leucine-rich repeat (LRR) protein
MTTPNPNHRSYHPTPARIFIGLLAVQVLLFLSERFQWFAFNEHKGWTVLIAVGVVGVAVLVMLLWFGVCLLLRWRFQFSFRSLLLFVVAVSVALGWFAWEMQRARRQREAVERILEAGGNMWYDYDYDAKVTLGPAWLRKSLGDDFFHEVVLVHLVSTGFDDNGARHLRELRNVKYLFLSNTQITDKALAHLLGMTELTDLNLDNTHITDNGLARLAKMTNLKALSLSSTAITNAGLAHLEGMSGLEELWLGNTQVTDDGLVHLEGLANLERLFLDQQLMVPGPGQLVLVERTESQITDKGVKKLRQALPNCHIEHQPPRLLPHPIAPNSPQTPHEE